MIPDEITTISPYTFRNCTGFESITLHNSIEKIEDETFYGCQNIKYAVIPKNLLYIKNNAFYRCNSLQAVFFGGNSSEWDEMLIYDGNEPLTTANIIYNATKKTYKLVTNCESDLPDLTTYCISKAPVPTNHKQAFVGWFDNADLTGEAIKFPYYGDATTLYAKWAERTGNTLDDALYIEDVGEFIIESSPIFYEFTPKYSSEYRIYSTGDVYGTRATLYENDRYLTSDNRGDDYFKIVYNLEAGVKYCLRVECLGYLEGGRPFTLVIETDESTWTRYDVQLIADDGNIKTITYLPQEKIKRADIEKAFMHKVTVFSDKDKTKEYDFDTPVNDNLTLYVTLGEEITVIPGDMDEDGEVSINDAIYLFNAAMFPDTYPIPSGQMTDYNSDGTFDMNDAIYLFNHAMFPDAYPI